MSLEKPSPSDVTPLEERSYWPDGDTLARRGRVKEVKRYSAPTAAPLVTSYDYDAFGPFQVTEPSGGITIVVRDGRGRSIAVMGPDGGVRRIRYHDGLDPALQLLSSGGAIRSGYDGMGRLLSVEYLSGDPRVCAAELGWSEQHTYDTAGNRIHTERRDRTGAVTWQQDREYDVQHRLVRETNPENPATARTNAFDASGFLASVTDEEGRTTTYTPDPISRVKKVTRSGVDELGSAVSLDVAQYTYQSYADALSQRQRGVQVSEFYGNTSATEVRTLDRDGHVLKLTAIDLAGFGITDEIVKEAPGGAHRDPKLTGENIRTALRRHLADLEKMSPADLVRDRYQKYRVMGMYTQEE